jgi:branched-chain amino acid aminotransferase
VSRCLIIVVGAHPGHKYTEFTLCTVTVTLTFLSPPTHAHSLHIQISNYASTISPQTDAASKGYTQVMWLFGPDAEVTEVGTMNVFFVWTTREGKRQLVTAPLDGTILPGVTRSSALELARGWGDLEVVERVFTMGEVTEAIDEGRMLEAFGTGTAAVLSPIASVHFEGRDLNIPLDAEDPDALAGPVAQRMWDEITSIQYGKKESDWSVIVE